VARAQSSQNKGRSITGQRTGSRKAAPAAKPTRSIRQTVASRSAGKKRVSPQNVDKKRSSTVRRSGTASRETAGRTSRTSNSRSATSARTSRRSTGY
jgi:hypothetical protein